MLNKRLFISPVGLEDLIMVKFLKDLLRTIVKKQKLKAELER